MLTGTPTMPIDQGGVSVTYSAADGTGMPQSETFRITVQYMPDMPDAPTVTPNTTSGDLDVSWDMPADNNDPIIYYQVQHRMMGETAWSVPPVNATMGTSYTFTDLTDGETYEFQVRAVNSLGMSDWSATGSGIDPADPPVAPTLRGQITRMEIKGNFEEKTIGGDTRIHVEEGELDLSVELEVSWTHKELTELHAQNTKYVFVDIYAGWSSAAGVTLPDWVSWLDYEQDVDFPDTRYGGGMSRRLLN